MSATRTEAPSRANLRATARPNPFADPVTIATLSRSLMVFSIDNSNCSRQDTLFANPNRINGDRERSLKIARFFVVRAQIGPDRKPSPRQIQHSADRGGTDSTGLIQDGCFQSFPTKNTRNLLDCVFSTYLRSRQSFAPIAVRPSVRCRGVFPQPLVSLNALGPERHPKTIC